MDPFAPAPSSSAQQDQAPCPRCGQPMGGQGAYDDSGEMVCRTCLAHGSSAAASAVAMQSDPGRLSNIWYGAVGSVIVGLGTLCTLALGEWFFVAAPLALFAGAHTATRLLRDPSYRTKMGAGFGIALALCGIGTLLGLLATGLGLVSLLLS